MKAACTKTLERVPGAFLTGFTSRAVAALIHLREAWAIADATNKPFIEDAMRDVLATRALSDQVWRPFVIDTLDEAQGAELWSRLVTQ